jgi:hypothetical protein
VTAQEFVKGIERYYGAYDNSYKREVVERFMARMEIGRITALYEMVLLYFSDRYGKVPDVAAIRDIEDSHADELKQKSGEIYFDQQEAYRNGEYLGHYDSGRFIPYLRSIQVAGLITEYTNEFVAGAPTPESFAKFIDSRPELCAPSDTLLIESDEEEA